MERDVLMPRGGGKDTGVPTPEHGGQQEAAERKGGTKEK